MDNILTSLFNIALFPFTSRTDLVILPCMMWSVIGGMALLGRIIRGNYRAFHID